jgi:hypothetical protein
VIAAALPVRITGINLLGKHHDIRVDWNVENELSIHNYYIEHSLNGRDFTTMKSIAPAGMETAKMYSHNISGIEPGKHFFRIRAESLNGKTDFSTIAVINTALTNNGISVYPNPVLNKKMQLHFTSLVTGKYAIEMINNNGQQINLGTRLISSSQSELEISLPARIQPGIYRLRITGPNQYLFVQTVSVD